MSTKYRFGNNEIPHFITMTTIEWIDLFNRHTYKQILIDNLKFCISNKSLNVHAFVIMSNHAHFIVSANDSNTLLSSIIKDYKRYSAKVIYETLEEDRSESRRQWLLWMMNKKGKDSSSNENFKLWQHENHPIELSTNKMITQKLNYIHQNPVKAQICYNPEDYIYSSASAYAGMESIINLSFLD